MSPFLLENYAFNGQTYQATLPSGNVTSISELCSVVVDEQAEIEWKESGYWNFSLTSFEMFPTQKHELGSTLAFSRKPHSKSLSLKKHHSINYNSIRCLDFRRFIFPVHETITTATEKLSTGRAWLWNPVGQKSLVCKWQIPGVCDRDLFPNEQSNDETALSRKEGVFADIRRGWNGCASRFCHYHQPCITLLPVCFWRVAHFFDMGLKSFQIVQLWTTSTEQEFFQNVMRMFTITQSRNLSFSHQTLLPNRNFGPCWTHRQFFCLWEMSEPWGIFCTHISKVYISMRVCTFAL